MAHKQRCAHTNNMVEVFPKTVLNGDEGTLSIHENPITETQKHDVVSVFKGVKGKQKEARHKCHWISDSVMFFKY